jgi:uncharacterized membrane protein YeiH
MEQSHSPSPHIFDVLRAKNLLHTCDVETRLFAIPLWIDLTATFFGALSGATVAARRHYDIIGALVLSTVAGIGGALLRDGLFIQKGPPVVMQSDRYLVVCIGAALFTPFIRRLPGRITTLAFNWTDTLGLGLYGMIGVQTAQLNGLGAGPSVLVGVTNAVGGGIVRDLLINEESAWFKPGVYYVATVIAGASLFIALTAYTSASEYAAGVLGAATIIGLRILSLRYNLKTRAVG